MKHRQLPPELWDIVIDHALHNARRKRQQAVKLVLEATLRFPTPRTWRPESIYDTIDDAHPQPLFLSCEKGYFCWHDTWCWFTSWNASPLPTRDASLARTLLHYRSFLSSTATMLGF